MGNRRSFSRSPWAKNSSSAASAHCTAKSRFFVGLEMSAACIKNFNIETAHSAQPLTKDSCFGSLLEPLQKRCARSMDSIGVSSTPEAPPESLELTSAPRFASLVFSTMAAKSPVLIKCWLMSVPESKRVSIENNMDKLKSASIPHLVLLPSSNCAIP